MSWWGLASVKFVGLAGRLEIAVEFGVIVLNLKTVWRQNSLLLGEPQSLLLRPSIICMSLTHIREITCFTQSLLI